MKLLSVLLAVLSLFLNAASAQTDFVDGARLTSINAPWIIQILGNDLNITNVRVKPDERSAYFVLASDSTKLNVTVFIEPVLECETADECRERVIKVEIANWGKLENLTRGRLRDFSYFEFSRPQIAGQPANVFDMQAEYVSDGYWVDVHISKVDYTKNEHALFEKVMNSIAILPKKNGANNEYSPQLSMANAAGSSWFSLWDSFKCKESYGVLSAPTRGEIKEKMWVDYCLQMNEGLGVNRYRKLIGSAFTRSPKSDGPIAILAYHSNFTKRSATVEVVGLTLEKNGTWTVSNYLAQ